MAIETTMKYAVRRIAQAFQKYTSTLNWSPSDYQLFVRFNEEWGQIHLILVAKAFPQKKPEDQWLSVKEFLRKEFKDDPALRDALHLVLLTFDQVAEGGLYSIGPDFEDINDLLTSRPAAS